MSTLYVLDHNEQIIDVLGGESKPFFNDQWHEVINGDYTFTFETHASYSEYIEEGYFVVFKDQDGNHQMFEIDEIDEVHEEDHTLQFSCVHAFYELKDDFIKDVRPQDASAAFALGRALEDTRWSPGTVHELGTHSTNFYDVSPLASIKEKIIPTWGGELQYSIEMVGKRVTARTMHLLERRGTDTGKRIEYTKDIRSITRTVDMGQVKTLLYGRGKGEETTDEDGEATGGYGRRLTFADINDGKDYVADEEALLRFGRLNEDGSRRHRQGIHEMSDVEDPEELLEGTKEALKQTKEPKVTYSVSMVDLYQLGFDHEKVSLGDTLVVIDREFMPVLTIEARVIERKGSLTEPETGELTLGNYIDLYEDDKKLQRIESTLNYKEGIWDDKIPKHIENTQWLEGKINALQNQLVASGAYERAEVLDNQGFLLENTNAQSEDYGALYIGPGIFALADEVNNETGQWDFRTFGTPKGFTADELNAGVIRTALIKLMGEDGLLTIENNKIHMRSEKSAQKTVIEPGEFTLTRPDGHDLIFGGMLNLEYNVQFTPAPWTDTGVEHTGRNYRTSETSPRDIAYGRFRRDGRYLNLTIGLRVEEEGESCIVRVESTGETREIFATTVETSTSDDWENMERSVLIDFGVPDGERQLFYVTVQSENGTPVQARVVAGKVEG